MVIIKYTNSTVVARFLHDFQLPAAMMEQRCKCFALKPQSRRLMEFILFLLYLSIVSTSSEMKKNFHGREIF